MKTLLLEQLRSQLPLSVLEAQLWLAQHSACTKRCDASLAFQFMQARRCMNMVLTLGLGCAHIPRSHPCTMHSTPDIRTLPSASSIASNSSVEQERWCCFLWERPKRTGDAHRARAVFHLRAEPWAEQGVCLYVHALRSCSVLQNLIGLVLFWLILFGASALFVVQYQNGLKRQQNQR